MTNEKPTNTAPPNPETTTPDNPSGQKTRNTKKVGRSKKTAVTEVKAPITFSFSPSFVKKLKMLGGSLDCSLSDYVESRLSGIVSKDLRRVLEDMG